MNLINIDTIIYNGREYPLKSVIIDGHAWAVSTLELEEALIPEETGDYADELAERIDEQIGFFLSAEEFNWPIKKIQEYIQKEIG